MLSEQQIKQAEINVKSYLSENLLKRVNEHDSEILNILVKNSKESLSAAEILYNGHSNLWTIVCSYYGMYYMANPVLLKLGYKVGDKISHKVVADSLIVYVRYKLAKSLIDDFSESQNEALEIACVKAEEIVQDFEFERNKRSIFQYSMSEHAVKSKAFTSLNRSKKFIFEMEKLLLNEND